jgi:hypothetical protein
LVTFDHLSKCPRCETSFDLSRRLTRRRSNPNRRIKLPAAGSEQTRGVAAPGAVAPAPKPVAATVAAAAAPAEPATTPAPPVSADHDTEIAPASGNTPTLKDLAESEQRDDVAVNVAAAVTAVRDAVQVLPPVPPADPIADAPGPPEPAKPSGSAMTDSQTIKERMMRASRARRKERPDLVTESIDPALPDWYEPDLDEPNGAPSSKGKSAGRR